MMYRMISRAAEMISRLVQNTSQWLVFAYIDARLRPARLLEN